MIVRKSIPLAFEADNILDIFHLALEEYSAFIELVRVVFSAGDLLKYLADACHDKHLIRRQYSLETLRQRTQIEEQMILDVESLNGRLRLGRTLAAHFVSAELS